MLEESPVGSNLSRKAVLLMAEILQMSNRVLPLSIAAQIQVFTSCPTPASPTNRLARHSLASSI